MIKFKFVVGFILLSCNSLCSQNLIPNSSFEIDTLCPAGYSQLANAPPWFQPLNFTGSTSTSGSSDLFDTCSSPFTAGIPTNVFGYQQARTGKAYAGICLHFDTLNYREYLEVPLLAPLIANETYCISFYVSLANASSDGVSNFGTYFSLDSLLFNYWEANAIDTVTPQFENPTTNMLNDTANWMLVSGSFIAAGGERFVTIGNFHKPSNTNLHYVGTTSGYVGLAYYYVEDVDVHCCSADCGVGVGELGIRNQELRIVPNPVGSNLTISQFGNLKIEGVKIYDVMGQCVIKSEVKNQKSKEISVDVSVLAKGLYFVTITTDAGLVNRKIVKE